MLFAFHWFLIHLGKKLLVNDTWARAWSSQAHQMSGAIQGKVAVEGMSRPIPVTLGLPVTSTQSVQWSF